MGLDMYLYKVNKKVKNEEELKEVFNKYKKGPTYKEINTYELLLKDKPFEAIKCMNPWRYIELDEFSYNEEDGKLRYNEGRGIDIISYFESCTEEIKEFYEQLVPKVAEYMKCEDKDSIYVISGMILYWRKHPDLHDYMERLYIERGGEEEFNCVNLILNKEDIEKLIENIKAQINGDKVFRERKGFFFGKTIEEDWEKDLEAFNEVLLSTDWDKETIYYSAWY